MKNKRLCQSGADDQQHHEENDGEINKDWIRTSNVAYEMQRCPICLNYLSQDVGIPENCYHAFCVTCILKWSETSTSCPVDRKPFQAVFKIDPVGGFTKIQVKPRRLIETRENCCNINHCYSPCCANSKICIRVDSEPENTFSGCNQLEKGCQVTEEKNESVSENLSWTNHCPADFSSIFPSSYSFTIPLLDSSSAEVSEDYEIDLIRQKRKGLQHLSSPTVVKRIESCKSLSMDTEMLILPSSSPDDNLFPLSFFSIRHKDFSMRSCGHSGAQEGTEKKQTASGSSNSRGSRKKPVPSSTRRRSARNSKSEDASQVPSSPKSSNSDRDTSGHNSTNASSSEKLVKPPPKRRKRAPKKASQVRKRLRSAAQTREESSESEQHSANESEQELDKKHKVSGESLSELEIVNSDTEGDTSHMTAKSPSSPSANAAQCGSVSSPLEKEKCSDEDLPPSPSSQNEHHCDSDFSSSPVLNNGQSCKGEKLPISSDSEPQQETEGEDLPNPRDTRKQCVSEREHSSDSETKHDSEGAISPVSERYHHSKNDDSPLHQECEDHNSAPSPASEGKPESEGEFAPETSDENLQENRGHLLESSVSSKEQDSEDLDASDLNVQPMPLSPSSEKAVTHNPEESLDSIDLNKGSPSEVANSTTDKSIKEAKDSFDSEVGVSENESDTSVSADKLTQEQKHNGNKEANGLTEIDPENANKCIPEMQPTVFSKISANEDTLDTSTNEGELTLKSIEETDKSLKTSIENTPAEVLQECKVTIHDNNASVISDANTEQQKILCCDDEDNNVSVAMDCDSVCSDQHDSEVDHVTGINQEENVKPDSDTAKNEVLSSPNTEPKHISDDKTKKESRKRKSRFHSPSTMWSAEKGDLKERQRSLSPDKGGVKDRKRSCSPDKEDDKGRPRSRSKVRDSPAKPRSRSRSRDRGGDRDNSGQWKGRNRDRRPRQQSRSKSRTRSRSRSGSRTNTRNNRTSSDRNEKECFSPPWKERRSQENWKGSRGRGNERYRQNERERPNEHFRNDWHSRNKDAPEQHHEDRNKNDPDWVMEKIQSDQRGRGQDRGRISHRGSHRGSNWEENQHNSGDSWNKNDDMGWNSPRGRGFRGRGGFRGGFGIGDQNENRWNRSPFSGNSNNSGNEPPRFTDQRNYRPKFEQNQFGSPAARSGWSSESSWAVRKTLPADVQNYYSKRGRNSSGSQSVWPPPEESQEQEQPPKDQTSQQNEGSQIPVNIMPTQMNVVQQQINAPPPPQPLSIFPYPVAVHPPMNIQHNPQIHNPYNIHPPVPMHLHPAAPLVQVSAPTNVPQGLPPPPPPPPPSQQVNYITSQPDGKQLQKIQIQERAAYEVKTAIKPYYQNKDITKDEYKEIVKKAVDKVCHSKSGEVDSAKVANLVKAYVDKYKHSRKKGD
ncbi:protein SCAF11 isoform 2-T2 [Discoglossus pictus]